MENLKYQLYKAYRHEEALLRYYKGLLTKMGKYGEIKLYIEKNIKKHEENLEEIKRLLKKYCSS